MQSTRDKTGQSLTAGYGRRKLDTQDNPRAKEIENCPDLYIRHQIGSHGGKFRADASHVSSLCLLRAETYKSRKRGARRKLCSS